MTYTVATHKQMVERGIAAVKRIIEAGIAFEGIAYTGISGSVVAPVVAHHLDKVPVAVRKDESAHNRRPVILPDSPDTPTVRRVVLVDDFVSTGDTVMVVKQKLSRAGIIVVAVATYDRNRDRRRNYYFDGSPRVFGYPSDGTRSDWDDVRL